MKIKTSIYMDILTRCPPVPPETGGIIGGCGEIINEVFFDICPCYLHQAIYRPNFAYLNNQIMLWHKQGIAFRGIFHSHPPNEFKLSSSDREYISRIMLAMPDEISELFFPIVIPMRNVVVYRAKRETYGVIVRTDSLQQI